MGVITSLFARKMVSAAGPSVDQSSLLAMVGLDPDAQADADQMVSDLAYYDLLETIAQQIDVTDLPLKVAGLLAPDDYGALGLAWKTAPTLLGSFSRVARFAALWTSVVEYELKQENDVTYFYLHRSGARRLGLRLSNEATLASAVSISRQVCPVPFSPVEVHLRHPSPKTVEHHETYFGCPVMFGSDFDGLVMSNTSLGQKNILGDAGITRFLVGHLEDRLRSITKEPSLEHMTKDAIARSLSEGLPKMTDIARSLGMSNRSFHRRLSEGGLSFRALTKATREELAKSMLQEGSYSIAEIAFLTGFSEQSAFTRAFKSWHGMTPASFRAAHIH